ncbi:hypothetical protein GCM10029964_116730 [Kibdelosporangium lantanae]
MSEVTDSDHRDAVAAGQPEDAFDLVHEHADLVTHTARPVGTDVRKVLPQLRGIHAGGLCELLAGEGDHTLLGHTGQHPQVDREPGHGGLGDGPGALDRRVGHGRDGHGDLGRAGRGRHVPVTATLTPRCRHAATPHQTRTEPSPHNREVTGLR